tara:strand:- start:8713 stop:10329 length:1617 start_codon:yes stop_codon:yes gene_type:complete
MALLDGQTQKGYYDSNNLGSYQFVSLQDVIAQFMAIYVGEEKIINKVGRTEVAFHAQRALAELSFDTLKSFKSQSIVLPPSLVMSLPHDYVNYTKLSWCDEAGIKHPIYKTNDTSNPFQISQNADGSYEFPGEGQLAYDFNFNSGSDSIGADSNWVLSSQAVYSSVFGGALTSTSIDSETDSSNPRLKFSIRPKKSAVTTGTAHGYALYLYQEINVDGLQLLQFSGNATTTAARTITVTSEQAGTTGIQGQTSGTFNLPGTTIRLGFSTTPPAPEITMRDYVFQGEQYVANDGTVWERTSNASTDLFDLGYLEWTQGESGIKNYDEQAVDVSSVDGSVYLIVLCIADHTDVDTNRGGSSFMAEEAFIDDIVVDNIVTKTSLSEANPGKSSTWDKYKAVVPAENNNDDYANDDYQRVPDERYGLDPAFAQTNGSFYIDDRLGRIHFSSNISGKTVILDYISDSLGTEAEMQIHKLAEEAMYKSITYGVLSVKSNIPEYIVMRARKEKIAATRKAKLRLSNVKIEDITQILRGKSKHIKH